MNKTGKNLLLDIVLFLIFIAVISTSLILEERETGTPLGWVHQAWVIAHILAGCGLLAGSLIHLWWHRDWIRVALRWPTRQKSKQFRRIRAVDLWLSLAFGVTCLSGLLIVPVSGLLAEGNPAGNATLFGLTFYSWLRLHAWGSVIVLLLVPVHLLQHWRWVGAALGRYLFKSPRRRLQTTSGNQNFS